MYLTTKQLEKLFWNITTQMLGYDPALSANASKVRISWPVDGAPAFKITDDVAFIRIGEVDNQDIAQPIERTYSAHDTDNALENANQTRVLNVHWSFYAPNGTDFDNAFTVRRLLHSSFYGDQFAEKGIYLIPSPTPPVRNPELFAGQWWGRSDYTCRFNQQIDFDDTIPYLKSAQISLRDKTDIKDISVTENTIVRG